MDAVSTPQGPQDRGADLDARDARMAADVRAALAKLDRAHAAFKETVAEGLPDLSAAYTEFTDRCRELQDFRLARRAEEDAEAARTDAALAIDAERIRGRLHRVQ